MPSPPSSALRPGLAVLADYGQLVPPALLDLPLGALNLHPSLLPRHRGATPIPATILAGDRETGVTLIRMDEGLDTGPIVARRTVTARRDRDDAGPRGGAGGRRRRPARRRLEPWLRGELGAGTAAGDRRDADPAAAPRGRPARPRPSGGRARTAGPRLPAVARLVRRDRRGARGRVGRRRRPERRRDTRDVRRGSGWRPPTACLRLREVQPAGGRRMPWDAFLRGRPGDRRQRCASIGP